MNYPFKHQYGGSEGTIRADLKTFQQWEKLEITTEEAAMAIAFNNDAPLLSNADFIDLANSLGWIQEPKAVLKAWKWGKINSEDATKMMSRAYGRNMTVEQFENTAHILGYDIR